MGIPDYSLLETNFAKSKFQSVYFKTLHKAFTNMSYNGMPIKSSKVVCWAIGIFIVNQSLQISVKSLRQFENGKTDF